MKYYDWDKDKNEKLREQRGIGFEEIVDAIDKDQIITRIVNPNKSKYPDQVLLILNIDNYAYVVPYVEDDEKIFLKTIIPSRKYTKKYILKYKS